MPIPIGYRETIVTPKTSRNVEAFWSFTAQTPGQSLILPDGRCDIILRHNVGRPSMQTPVVTGPATQPYIVNYDSGDCWLGMRLRPNYGALLWRNQMKEAANTVLRGPDAISLVPNLRKRKITLADLATSLQPTVPSDPRLLRALDVLHASGGRISIAELAVFAGCTARHLNRIFMSHVGLGAKTYAQLVQFHRTLKLIQQASLPITDAAFEGGYADHAHLTRAFRRFGGFKPSAIPQDLSRPTLFA